MPRRQQNEEARALRLWQSFSREREYFARALASPAPLAFDYGSPGIATNTVQKFHRCRVFLREQKEKDRSIECFDDVLVRRVGSIVVLQYRAAPAMRVLTAEETAALFKSTPPMTFVLPEPPITVQNPFEQRAIDLDEVFRVLVKMERMNDGLDDTVLNACVMPEVDNDRRRAQEVVNKLFETGRLRYEGETVRTSAWATQAAE